MTVGPEALASGPTRCLITCLSVRLDKAPDGAPECAFSTRRASVLLAPLDDVFTDDELAGCASAELLQGEVAHHLLVRRRCNLP